MLMAAIKKKLNSEVVMDNIKAVVSVERQLKVYKQCL